MHELNIDFYFQLNESGENQMDLGKGNENVQETTIPSTVIQQEEVDEFIDQSIQINSNKEMRIQHLYPWTLKFKDTTQESKYCQLREDMFRSNMLCVFIVWLFIVLCQAIIIPKCTVLVVCLTISTIFLTIGCILVMAEEFSSLPIFLQKSSANLVHHRDRRTLFICSVIFLMSVASSVGLWLCPMELNQSVANSTLILNLHSVNDTELRTNPQVSAVVHKNFSDINHLVSSNISKFMHGDFNNIPLNEQINKMMLKNEQDISPNQHDNGTSILGNGRDEPCSHPEYLVFTWVLCLIALATGLKLYYLVKTFMASIMVCCYAVLISVLFPEIFENASTESEENSKYGMPLTARMNILLVVFLTMVTYHARLVEVTSRLDFIWKEQAEKELSNMKSNRILNDLLIKVRLLFRITQ